MSSSICLRCLKRSLVPIDSSLPPNAAQRAAFSTSPSLSANPPKKKSVVAKPAARSGRTLKLAKNKRAVTARPPAPGERKALRKRVVLSNTNALEVQGLQDFTAGNTTGTKSKLSEGKVLGLGNDTVDALRALEAFKPTQGWSLFRRPATLVRKETVELARLLEGIKDGKKVERRLLFGEKGSGKSVLVLQGMAMAYLKGWVVVHFPDAKDITIAHTSYRPVKTSEGKTIYIQPHYTAQLLGNIVKANQGLLNSMRLSGQHQIPVPIQQSNWTLARFAELGANDPELAWPVWQALWKELTAPSSDEEGLKRPPVFVSLDGVDHIMRNSAYLDSEAQPVHAHDLALVRDFVGLLSGQTTLPNGGMVIAANSESNRPSAPTLDHCITRSHAEPHIPALLSLRDRLRKQAASLQDRAKFDMSALNDYPFSTLPSTLSDQLTALRRDLRNQRDPDPKSTKPLLTTLDNFKPKLPEWDPYLPIDQRVTDVMSDVHVQKVTGLSKEEARGVMEYYAQSGMLRHTVTEGLVSERWTLAGQGIVGELEKGTVRVRF